MNQMTQQEVIESIHVMLDDPIDGGTNEELTALGMICADIEEFGFEAWLDMPAIKVVESHIEATEAVAEDMLEDLETLINQESEIESLGVAQTMRIDTLNVAEGLKEGLMGVMKAMLLYLNTQEFAKINYEPTS